jgi:hypothetical protein
MSADDIFEPDMESLMGKQVCKILAQWKQLLQEFQLHYMRDIRT